jgi:2-polyprenyl-6-methoxyphenol hydroxylase-like FAD-dependent oxidoreductase
MTSRSSVLIGGGGIIGAACAAELSQRGVSVALIDKGPLKQAQAEIRRKNVEISGRQALGLCLVLFAVAVAGTAGFGWLRHGSGFDFQRVLDWLRGQFRLNQ